MLGLPVHPRLARILIAARQCGRTREGATVAALLSEKDIRIREGTAATGVDGLRPQMAGRLSDVLDRLDRLAEAEAARFATSLRSRGIDASAARQVALLRDQLLRHALKAQLTTTACTHDQAGDEEILKWLLLAFPDRVVKSRGADRTGVMVSGRGARLGAESIVGDTDMFLAIDAREERRAGLLEIRVNLASTVRLEWLEELLPNHLRRERLTRYDESRKRVISATRLWYQDLLLREDVNPTPGADETGSVLAQALRPEASRIFRGNPQAAAWLARLDLLRRYLPELKWPDFSDHLLAGLLDSICQGKSARDQVEQADLIPFLQSVLDPGQNRELRQSAPLSLALPSGRPVRLAYEPGKSPVLAARVQELFGWAETPRLARGRAPLLLHILGPNNRPVQITDDLHSFWTTTYQRVRKDLRGRYPKHAWPANPLEAPPISR
jgi:ATP-dependent helicase HrpB